MTAQEKEQMMAEIMQVVDKHISKSENKTNMFPQSQNKYGREFGISDDKMAKWKEEYRAMRVDTKKVLDEVRKHPIDVSMLDASFDIEAQSNLLK